MTETENFIVKTFDGKEFWVETNPTNFILKNDDNPDIKFEGYYLNGVSSKWVRGQEQNRWTDLEVYLTVGGSLIFRERGLTQWQGEHDRHAVTVCKSFEDLIEAAGHGWLAKELYESLKINDAEKVA